MRQNKPHLTLVQGPGGDMSEIGQGPGQETPKPFRTLDGLLDYHEDMLRGWWNEPERTKDDVFDPMLIGVCANGDLVPVVASAAFRDDDSKDQFTAYMRERMREWNVVRYIMISEAWAMRTNGELPNVPPSQSPDRYEIIMMLAADATDAKGRTLQMIRDWQTGKVVHLIREHGDDGDHSGRFANLLKPEPPRRRALSQAELEAIRVGLDPSLHGNPDRFDHYDRDKEKAAVILAAIENAQKMAQNEIVGAAGGELLAKAVREAKALILSWVEGWARRDGPSSLAAKTLREAEALKARRKQ